MIARLVVALMFALLAGAGTPAAGAGVKVNTVAEQVTPIRTFGDKTDPALLLVYVTDHHGNPLDGVQLALAHGPRDRGRGTTGRDGTALLRLPMTAHLTVRAALVGFVPAEARKVLVKMGGFTAVALPLEVAQVDPLE